MLGHVEQIPPEIVRHYQTIDEGVRITEGPGRLERQRTQDIVSRFLPSRRCSVLDVGGATGVHASWLASLGHDVHVVDLLAHHVAAASQLSAPPGRVTAEVGDARRLPVADAAFDVVLLFGPLYHLTDRADRLRAWEEARRAVRPGGMVFAGAISRFASVFDGLARGYLLDPAFRAIVQRDLRDGQHRNPSDQPHWFTTAFFHHPDELRSEALEAGVDVLEVVGVEGLAGWLTHVCDQWDRPEVRDAMVFAAAAVESEPSLLGLSAHLITVGQRPS